MLAPERITEYPNPLDLSEELRQRPADLDTWRAAGVTTDDSYEIAPIASGEWNAGYLSWIPYEDRALAALGASGVNNLPGVHVGSTDRLQIHVRPKCPEHSHTDLIQ
ncbi:hypothetical protein ABZ871_25035 [Streptomyces populi]